MCCYAGDFFERGLFKFGNCLCNGVNVRRGVLLAPNNLWRQKWRIGF